MQHQAVTAKPHAAAVLKLRMLTVPLVLALSAAALIDLGQDAQLRETLAAQIFVP